MSKNSKRCWELGCHNKGIKCLIPRALIDGEDEKSRYCSDHAAKNGFCYSCGLFCAGIESFDFGRYPGLCDNCADEVRVSDAWDEIDEMDQRLWEEDMRLNTEKVYAHMVDKGQPLTVDEIAFAVRLTKAQTRMALQNLKKNHDLVRPLYSLEFSKHKMRDGAKQKWEKVDR